MTKEDIIRMAREAGFKQRLNNANEWFMWTHEIERFAALVATAEREACAQVCDDLMREYWVADPSDCAAAIRARGQA